MAAFYGIPIVGSVFIPVFVGAVTIFLFWNFVMSKNHVQITEDNLQEFSNVSLFQDLETKKIPKRKKKKARGSKKGCCDGGKNKSGSCSSKTGIIESLKVIMDSKSNFCEELRKILSQKSCEANLGCEFMVVSNCSIDTLLQNETQGLSMCLFIFDDLKKGDLYSWLEKVVENKTVKDKPLAGMKYAVFSIESNHPSGSSCNVRTDLWLHKLGAVRVCKAGKVETAGISQTAVLENFQLCTQELCDRVLQWNEPKNKVCKCGPKDEKDGCGKDSCSGSSSCSDSDAIDVEEIDLEDIGRVLNLKN